MLFILMWLFFACSNPSQVRVQEESKSEIVVDVTQVADVPNPREKGKWVSDNGDIIAPQVEERINTEIERLHQELGVEIALVTVDAIPTTPKDFAVELFEYWKIGDAQKDNGLLILMAMEQRRL